MTDLMRLAALAALLVLAFAASAPAQEWPIKEFEVVNVARIPLVDYGFSGTFDNAEVRFSRHSDGWLEALGADWKPNGRVMYEELERAPRQLTPEEQALVQCVGRRPLSPSLPSASSSPI